MHTKNFEALAIIFYLVNAPPPPLINCKFALTSSEPSTYIGISLTIYVDGADEVNANLQLIKGGGGALTREKIIASASKFFVCIVDESKVVDVLGKFPLPIEVLPMARSFVAR